MKLKHIFSTIVLGLAPAFLVAGPVGIAESRGEYNIQRGENILTISSKKQSIVQERDSLKTAEEPLLISTPNKSNLYLNSNTEVSLVSKSQIDLVQGQIALGFEEETPVTVTIQNLEIVPLEPLDSSTEVKKVSNTQGSSILADVVSADEIRIMGFGDTFVINDFSKGNQVAVIPSGDVMRLVRNAQGIWEPASFSGFNAAEEGVETNNLNRFVKSSDDRRVIFFWQGAVIGVAAVAGTAGALWYERNDDEDDENAKDRDDDDRNPTSPLFP